jgi:hypothetical protein
VIDVETPTTTTTQLPWRDGALYRRQGGAGCCAGPTRLRVVGHHPTATHAASVVVERRGGVTLRADAATRLAAALDSVVAEGGGDHSLDYADREELPHEETGHPVEPSVTPGHDASSTRTDRETTVVVERASARYGEVASAVVRWPHPVGGGWLVMALSSETTATLAADFRRILGCSDPREVTV